MMNKKISIDDYFKYHPSTTEERIQKHKLINKIILEAAHIIDESVGDEKCKEYAFFALQQARMFANQGVVVDELRNQM